jgi:hypothetical protein
MARNKGKRGPAITQALVAETLGDIDDSTMSTILATGATVEEFEEAVAWATGESDVMGELEHPLSGAAAAVYDILTREREEQWQKEEQR